jgi:cholesterol oxidase
MKIKRRELLQWTATAGAGALAARCQPSAQQTDGGADVFDATTPMDAGADASEDSSATPDAMVPDGGTVMTRVLIIGSGFGGAVTALRLAERGISSIVLERGKRWPITMAYDTFSTLLLPDRRSTWLSETTVLPFGPVFRIQRYIGVLERVRGNGINIYAGAAVGGGSVVYGGFVVTPRESAFRHVFGSRLDYAELVPYYDRARQKLRGTRIPEDVFMHPSFNSERVWRQHAERAGVGWTEVDLSVDWDIIRREISGAVPPSALTGEVIYGNSNGCKLSLDRNYLADAEATGLCRIEPQHLVRDIAERAGGGYVVTVDRIDFQGYALERKTYLCEYLFLAAGCYGTTNLLLKAKAKGLLPRLDENVGQNFGNNGNAMFMRWGLSQTTGPNQASFGGQAIANFDNPISAALVEHAQFPSGVECNCLLHLGMTLDVGRGSMRYDPATDSAVIDWPMGTGDISVRAMQHLADRLNMANGGTLNGSSVGVSVNGILSDFTYHPLGGMVMGDATDSYGRVNNYQKLYVIDGSLLPRSAGGVNPALTIAAIAERNIERIIRDDFMQAGG